MAEFYRGGYGVISTNSGGDVRYRPDTDRFSYKILTLRLYNALYKKYPSYLPGISYTRGDLGELTVVIQYGNKKPVRG